MDLKKVEGVKVQPSEVKVTEQKTTSDVIKKDESVFTNKDNKVTKPSIESTTTTQKTDKPQKTSKNWFQRWLNNEDKISTDGKDDGKISFKEKMKSFGKGLMCIVKAAINHPIMTSTMIAAGIGLTILTGGAAAPVLVTLGVATGAGLIGYGSYKAATAETDGEAKEAWENIGQGTFTLAASVLSAKSALKTAAKGGVTSAQGAENMNPVQATIQSFKSTPEALKMSGLNAKGNILTWTTGKLHANSNVMRKNVNTAYSKPSESKAYKFDPSGTPEQVLAKNPYVKYDAVSKKYYVDTSWGEKSYLGKDYVVMEYGPNDVNAVSASDFKASYVDKIAFAKDGTKNYMDTTNMKPGEWTSVVKQAPVRYKIVPEGTKYVGKEGPATIQKDSLLMIDKDGSPYQNTVQTFIKRNGDLSFKKALELNKAYPKEASLAKLIKSGVIKDSETAVFLRSDSQKYLQYLGIKHEYIFEDAYKHWNVFEKSGQKLQFESKPYWKMLRLMTDYLESNLKPEEFYNTLDADEKFLYAYEEKNFITLAKLLTE